MATIEERAKSIFSNDEEWYKEIAYHCWISTFKVGEFYEGMRYDFNRMWESRKENLINHINAQLNTD